MSGYPGSVAAVGVQSSAFGGSKMKEAFVERMWLQPDDRLLAER